MSTRGAYGFRKDGKDRITYSHSDSYPSGLGVALMGYCRSHTREQMAAACDRIVLVDEGGRPTSRQIEDHLDLADVSVRDQSVEDFYCLLRDAQGRLEVYDDAKHYLMADGTACMAESFWTEWAYVIDLDEGTFEVYAGMNTDPTAPGRYAALGSDFHASSQTRYLDGRLETTPERTYHGVSLLATYPLSGLPGDPAGWAADVEAMAEASYELRWADLRTEYPDGTVRYGLQEGDR